MAGHVALGNAQPAPTAAAELPEGLTSRPWLYENMRHLYRWHLDERDIDAVVGSGEVVFWICEWNPELDEGDHSRFGEVILPQFSTSLKVKQADYAISELDVTVKNPAYRIASVSRIETPDALPSGYTEVRANYQEMRDELFRTRNQAQYPEGQLLERLRTAARSEIAKEMEDAAEPLPTTTQIVHLAPLSPTANEAWAFWETGRALIHFTSDIDLTDPSVWEHEKLTVRFYDLDEGVVVSLDEVAGSNAYMTRDQAGRALFNCMVLGRRVTLQPDVPAVE
jgi:hypothetical protein